MEQGSSCTAVPVEVTALRGAISALLTACGAADGWDVATRRAVLRLLDKAVDSLAVARGKVISAERADGRWSLAGDRDLAGFVGRESHQGRGAGLAAVQQAATLEALPAVAEALVDGPVTTRHVEQITRATSSSPALAAELGSVDGQARLVEMAGRLDASEFGTALRQQAAALDPASRQRAFDEQRAMRSLVVTRTPGGALLRGRLDSVAGHRLAKALDALCPRPAKDDERTREMRHADALAAMVDRVLSDRATTPGATAPVQAVVTLSEETWLALRGRSDDDGGADEMRSAPRSGRGSAADVVGRLRGVAPVVDETGQPWPASEVARALCDCTLTRVVLDAKGRPVDVGWKDRLFGKAQWLALYASGVRACSVDGCGMPLAYTELHHMTWWSRGGRTDLANCAPECTFHHGEIHRLDIHVSRRADGSYEHRYPDGRLYGGAPPGHEPAPRETAGALGVPGEQGVLRLA